MRIGVKAGNFLEFMLTKRGIKANPTKCQAIIDIKGVKQADWTEPDWNPRGPVLNGLDPFRPTFKRTKGLLVQLSLMMDRGSV